MKCGINFRATTGFVTDPADTIYEIAAGVPTNPKYPYTNALGFTVGWIGTGAPNTMRNRNSGNDARLAGLGKPTGGADDYRIDLPSSGSYDVRIAMGEASYAVATVSDLYDDTTLLTSLTTGSTSASQRFKDATNTQYTNATWPSSNTAYSATFSSTICKVRVASGSTIAHFQIESAGGGGGTTISATPGNAVADGTTASVTRTIPATPGNASADGITASVVRIVGTSPGNAAADGTIAAVTRTIATTPGNATADGVTATISTAGTTTISCTPGNAVADGVTATIAGTTVISCAPGNAVADGVAATVTNGASAAGGMGFEMGGSKKRRIVKIRWNGYDYTLDRDALPAFLESIEEQAEEKVTKKRNAKKKPAPLAKIVSAPADVMPDLKERIAAVNRSIGALWGAQNDEEEEEILWLMV